jgi:hypothetical protein
MGREMRFHIFAWSALARLKPNAEEDGDEESEQFIVPSWTLQQYNKAP